MTGGSRSIGAAIARRLAADGAAVALTYNASPEKADAVVRAIEGAGGKARAIRADAADTSAVRGAVAETVKAFGRLDVLVNNAGLLVVKPVDEVTLDDFDRMVAVNVRGLFVAIQEALRHMHQGGRIINIGSINSERVPFAGGTLYVLTKAAVAGLTRALARDLGPRGITVTNVQPGPTDTDMNPASGKFRNADPRDVALQRYATVDEIADFVAYLASPGASYITGAASRSTADTPPDRAVARCPRDAAPAAAQQVDRAPHLDERVVRGIDAVDARDRVEDDLTHLRIVLGFARCGQGDGAELDLLPIVRPPHRGVGDLVAVVRDLHGDVEGDAAPAPGVPGARP